jgi:hypothetical protein
LLTLTVLIDGPYHWRKITAWKREFAVKKSLLLVTLLLSFGCAEKADEARPARVAATAAIADPKHSIPDEKALAKNTLPKGWKLEEIAKAALPGATSGSTYVLAWKQIGDERPVLVDYCLVVTHIPDYCGRERWDVVSVARNPGVPKNGEWEMVLVHYGPGYKGFPQGAWVHHYKCFDDRPTNKEVYQFADEFGWKFDADSGFKLLDARVCKETWEAVLKEKPTRNFPKTK